MPKIIDNLDKLLNVTNVKNDSADLYIYGNIVSSWWGAWEDTDQYPGKIKNFLSGVKGKKLNVYINSGGGAVFAGMAIYNMIKRHDGEKIAHIDGIAGSISSVIPFSCDKVIVPSNGTFFVHKPLVQNISGNADDLRGYAGALDSLQAGLMGVYADNLASGATVEQVEELVNRGTYLSANEAIKYFNIELEKPKSNIQYVASMFEDYDNVPDYIKNKFNLVEKYQAQLDFLKLKGGFIE
jgi:ATP-dependent protease ClpP protease subunit